MTISSHEMVIIKASNMLAQKTKAAINLFCIIVFSIISILILFKIRGNFSEKNGFTRHILPITIKLVSKINNSDNLIRICGEGKKYFYFGNKVPGKVFFSLKNLSAIDTFEIRLSNNRIATRFETEIDTANIYLFAGNVPAIYIFNVNTLSLIKIMKIPIYSRQAIVNKDQILLRIFKNNNKKVDQVFASLNTRNDSLLYEYGISELKGDLGFSTDGILHYDKKTGMAVYLEFYRNKITTFDKNLKLIYRGHTIDTVSTNKTNYNAMKIGTEKEYSNNSPKHVVNKESCSDDGVLYVQSELMADNEKSEDFSKSTVIDMYRIKDNKYIGSFYLPSDEGSKTFKFRIFGKILIALYKNHIAKYQLN